MSSPKVIVTLFKDKGNYSAPTGLLIIAWGNAPGAGVYDLKPFRGDLKF